MGEKILSLKHITKRYPGVVALNDVSLDFYKGEVHALLGENGAGKSTLVKTIAGAIAPDEGTLSFSDGVEHKRLDPKLSKQYGVEITYQEINLIGCLSVAENICFGEELERFVNYKAIEAKAQAALDRFNVDIDPKSPVYQLPSSKQQIVEIAKAISKNVKLLILDEPTAPLSVAEVEKLFDVIHQLKQEGVSIIYISHRMDELFAIADKVSVLRDGAYIATMLTSQTDRKSLINCMVGRELSESYPPRQAAKGEVLLKVQHLSGNGDSDINLEVRAGEILGIGGLVGAGRTEMAQLIYGAVRAEGGEVIISGTKTKIKSPADGIKNGIGYIPEDRKQLGCLLGRSIRTNITLSALKSISAFGFINAKKEKEIAETYYKKLGIKAPDIEQTVANLSGGNQQKVVLAKTLATNSRIILFDEPTRGIDVGAKQEIYRLINELAEQGCAIIMITSEMEELLGMSDRIAVMYRGKTVGEISKEDFSQARVLELASGL